MLWRDLPVSSWTVLSWTWFVSLSYDEECPLPRLFEHRNISWFLVTIRSRLTWNFLMAESGSCCCWTASADWSVTRWLTSHPMNQWQQLLVAGGRPIYGLERSFVIVLLLLLLIGVFFFVVVFLPSRFLPLLRLLLQQQQGGSQRGSVQVKYILAEWTFWKDTSLRFFNQRYDQSAKGNSSSSPLLPVLPLLFTLLLLIIITVILLLPNSTSWKAKQGLYCIDHDNQNSRLFNLKLSAVMWISLSLPSQEWKLRMSSPWTTNCLALGHVCTTSHIGLPSCITNLRRSRGYQGCHYSTNNKHNFTKSFTVPWTGQIEDCTHLARCGTPEFAVGSADYMPPSSTCKSEEGL